MRRSVIASVAVVLVGLGISPVLGSMVEVDEILYQADVGDPGALAGTVDMVWAAIRSELEITLTNTSGDTGSSGAMNLLTGLGFTLPLGVEISGGDVSMLGAAAINFIAPGDNDVSEEWAYTNAMDSGHFDTVAQYSVNTVISSLKADGKIQFAAGSIDSGRDHNGIDFGLLMLPPSDKTTTDLIGGQESIQDKVTITLNLSGSVPANVVDLIDAEPVVLNFGSPDASTIPEPSTLILLCLGVLALPLYGWRKNR